jgi:hypothetical protein
VGDCLYCGKSAGWFRSRHKDCEAKHQAGREQIIALAQRAVKGGSDLAAVQDEVGRVSASAFISKDMVPKLWMTAWENAVQSALEDNVLTAEEETALLRAANTLGWKQEDLNSNAAFAKLVQAGVLRDLMEGKLPSRHEVKGQLPFNFQKGEELLWAFPGVKYYEVRMRRAFVGGSQGFSVRVARGVYYRVGGFRGEAVQNAETVLVDTGLLGVTQEHLYFAGPLKSFRVRFDKIVSFTPYSDGIGFQRDALTAKPQALLTGDGWFVYNLVTNLSSLQAERPSSRVDRPPREKSEDTDEGDTGTDLDKMFRLAIVGESHYQEALEEICGGERDDDGVDRVLNASLVLEDSNPYDPQAVRVDIDGKTVGYLSRPTARRFRQEIAAGQPAGTTLPCKARIKGGWDRGAGDRGHFGVWLNLSL